VLADELPGYFDLYGWRYERRESTVFRTGFAGEIGSWDIWVKVSDQLVVFLISPYAARDTETQPGPTLLRMLLQANHELNLAKLGVDDDLDICLSVEMPAESFAYTHFSDALTALAHYADEFKVRVDDAVAEDERDLKDRMGVA
jgi:hypothetical protein